jgi:class 3 adenylate cyclase/tetratricopeptide (TPR) repeat protein/ABC-type transport system involved in cytochrome c biogenesis ATPase subunit
MISLERISWGASMDIVSWLRNLGFGRYEQAFLESAIDSDVLPELTEGDLEKLGIPLGDRKRLIKAIREVLAGPPGAFITREIEGDTHGAQPRGVPAERRHLTVMICDLVDSTALSARLDPEDMGSVMNAYQAACAGIVEAYEGSMADFRGDGILAYFGHPHAHEDDAERTVRAALDIIAAVPRLETCAAEPLAVRIGIATGLVMVGDLSSEGALREHAVVGDTPNLSARLQALAAPGMIVVAGSTRRLLGGLFRLRDLGRHGVKGIAGPVAAWAVEGVSTSESRFEAVHAAGLTDLVDRKDEIDFLLERQHRAWKGEGQVVLISGEAGIGKSRLVAALAKRIADEPHTRLSYQCSPHHSNSALRPIITQLERAAGFKGDDTSEQRLDKLEAVLAMGASRIQAVAPIFAALMSIPFGERYPSLALSATQQRRRTLAALLDQFEGLARRQPILLLFEDAHWADATSLELLDLTVERMRQLPVLALFTFRTDFEAPWVGLANVGTLPLVRLDRNDIESVVKQLTGGRALPTEVMTQIVAKTDGNPLFVEELTKAVLEGDIVVEDAEGYRLKGPLPPLAIPATLQDSLMARLDRLAPVKEISQIGAAIGREFSYRLLHAVAGRDEGSLKHALAQLEQAELVFRRGEPPEAVYSFKHALVRDAAYESLLKSRRQQLHGQIARKFEERFADVVASQPEVVAYHFTEAGLLGIAIDYWLKAGNFALSRSENAEAVKHLRQGLELTQSQAPSPERARKELDFYLALGPAMAATEGYATPETLRVFSRARDLLGDGGNLSEQMTVLWGGYLAHSMRAEHVAALEVARQCLALAADHEHPGISALGNRFVGQTFYFMGSFVDARRHLERTLSLSAANQMTIAAYRKFGTDDQVRALSFLASTLLVLGYPEQSAAATGQAVSRARTIGLAFTTALALSHVAFLGTIGGDPRQAAVFADEAVALSVKQRLAAPGHRARFIQGALLAQSGDPQHGIELMRNAMAAAESSAARYRRTLYLGHVASAYASLGQPEVGLNLLNEAIQTAVTTNERFFEAELYRLRGKMLLTLGKRGEAEAGLRRALTTAQEQRARWWELRAATSLAEYLRDEGEYLEAYSLVQPVYSWFVEGFETPDLKDAKALLDELKDH